MKDKRVVIFGLGEFAEVAAVYLDEDSPYEVVAFAVDRAYLDRESLLGRPVVAYEDVVAGGPLAADFGPDRCEIYVAAGYKSLNSVREALLTRVKADGFRPVTYVSSRATRWPGVEVGEHCFIFEGNVLQPFSRVGANCVLWTGSFLGHHSTIGDHCFVTSHVLVSGGTTIGRNCFLGTNATIGHHIAIGAECVIGAGAVVLHDTEPGGVYLAAESQRFRIRSRDMPLFRGKPG